MIFNCAPDDASTRQQPLHQQNLRISTPDSGILDEDEVLHSPVPQTIWLLCIPSSDRVVAGTDSDLTNANQMKRQHPDSAVFMKMKQDTYPHSFIWEIVNTLKIEIMNYGVSRPQPDKLF